VREYLLKPINRIESWSAPGKFYPAEQPAAGEILSQMQTLLGELHQIMVQLNLIQSVNVATMDAARYLRHDL